MSYLLEQTSINKTILLTDEVRLHQFGANVCPGTFIGYALNAVTDGLLTCLGGSRKLRIDLRHPHHQVNSVSRQQRYWIASFPLQCRILGNNRENQILAFFASMTCPSGRLLEHSKWLHVPSSRVTWQTIKCSSRRVFHNPAAVHRVLKQTHTSA